MLMSRLRGVPGHLDAIALVAAQHPEPEGRSGYLGQGPGNVQEVDVAAAVAGEHREVVISVLKRLDAEIQTSGTALNRLLTGGAGG